MLAALRFAMLGVHRRGATEVIVAADRHRRKGHAADRPAQVSLNWRTAGRSIGFDRNGALAEAPVRMNRPRTIDSASTGATCEPAIARSRQSLSPGVRIRMADGLKDIARHPVGFFHQAWSWSGARL